MISVVAAARSLMLFAPADRRLGPSAWERQRECRAGRRVGGASGPPGRLEDRKESSHSQVGVFCSQPGASILHMPDLRTHGYATAGACAVSTLTPKAAPAHRRCTSSQASAAAVLLCACRIFRSFGGDRLRRMTFPGTYRIRSPQPTLLLSRPVPGEFGIAGLADVTGLDVIGMPLVMAVRPGSPSRGVRPGELVRWSGSLLTTGPERGTGRKEWR